MHPRFVHLDVVECPWKSGSQPNQFQAWTSPMRKKLRACYSLPQVEAKQTSNLGLSGISSMDNPVHNAPKSMLQTETLIDMHLACLELGMLSFVVRTVQYSFKV